jgi:cbb3-type cytochrome oxidase subunit 3
MSGAMWSLVTILGPILLIAAIVWAFLRNRRAGRGSFDRAERGAQELRDELERDPQYRDE